MSTLLKKSNKAGTTQPAAAAAAAAVAIISAIRAFPFAAMRRRIGGFGDPGVSVVLGGSYFKKTDGRDGR